MQFNPPFPPTSLLLASRLGMDNRNSLSLALLHFSSVGRGWRFRALVLQRRRRPVHLRTVGLPTHTRTLPAYSWPRGESNNTENGAPEIQLVSRRSSNYVTPGLRLAWFSLRCRNSVVSQHHSLPERPKIFLTLDQLFRKHFTSGTGKNLTREKAK